jgi:hypothetical protein
VMHQPTPPGGSDPPPSGMPPPGAPPEEKKEPELQTLKGPEHGVGHVLVNRYWLFAGPVLTADTPDEVFEVIEDVGIHGFHSFHGANASLDKLIMAARERFDPTDSWWHIVDVAYTAVVWDSENDRMQRH